MKSLLKFIINKPLNLINLEIKNKNADFYKSKYQQLLSEHSACLKKYLFPELKNDSTRDTLLMNLIGTTVSEATYIVHYLHKTSQISGDVCEFGVAQGATSCLIANEIKETNKNFWLFDSFQGLPKPTSKDKLIHDIFNLGSMEKYEGKMAFPDQLVRNKLLTLGFPQERTKIKKGYVTKKSLEGIELKNVSFAYVDFDFYEPILDTLRFLDKILSPGGVVIVDDYGYFSSGAKTAVDEFISQNSQYHTDLPFEGAGHFIILTKQ